MVKTPGTLSREETALCRILLDKRGLPPGDPVTKREALSKHLAALTKGDTLSPQQEYELRTYSRIAAQAVRAEIPESWFEKVSGHVSISNSACFENTRDFGGKRSFVLSCLRGWLLELPDKDDVWVLPTGESIIEKAGIPRWKTVKPPGMSEASDLPSGIRRSTGLLTEDFVDGEQERVGFQLFSWAYQTLITDGFLDRNGQRTGRPLPISRIAIGEPGCKVRIATKSKAAFIIYGQPFAHAMRELLEYHPSLRAGLGSGYQLFEWLKQLDRIPTHVMVGDFEAATDHIQHRAGKIAMMELLRAINGDKNRYAESFIDLLLSPRVIEEDGIVTITNSGCLMGEPGTKIVLTFLALVANCYARGSPSKLFATAGDDQIDAADSAEQLIKYAEASKITTMVPSEEKWGIMTHFAVYCQQLLDIHIGDPKKGEIPVPKPRLLSSETKTGRGDNDTNPSYGKASQFAKECEWSPFVEIKQAMTLMFLRNMRPFIEERPEVFLPREWGGLGLPGVEPSKIVPLLPEWHQKLIAHRESGDYGASKILAAWSSPKLLSRGLQDEPGESPYLETIEFYFETADIQHLGIAFPPDLRYREKLKIAKDNGWLPIDEVLETISSSHLYANIWDMKTRAERGFSSLSWEERARRMELASLKFSPLALSQIPEKPRWQPGKLVQILGLGALYELSEFECPDLEEGEVRNTVVPILGKTAQPRVFLHYDNHRLLLNATTKKRHCGEK